MKTWMYVPIIGFLLLFATCSGEQSATKLGEMRAVPFDPEQLDT